MVAYDRDSTSNSIQVWMQQLSSPTGKTGIAFNDADLLVYYQKGGRDGAIRIGPNTLASVSAAYVSGGWVAVDATNMPGLYRLDVPDVFFTSAAGINTGVVMVRASGAVHTPLLVEFTDAITVVSGRITAITSAADATLATMTTTLANISANVSTVSAAVAAVSVAVAGVASQVVNVSAAISNVSAAISNVSANISSVSAGINSVSAAISSVSAAVTNTSARVSSVSAAVQTIVARTSAIDGLEIRQFMAVIGAAVAGKSSGHESSAPVYRNIGDTLNRITATTDANGNRTAVSANTTG